MKERQRLAKKQAEKEEKEKQREEKEKMKEEKTRKKMGTRERKGSVAPGGGVVSGMTSSKKEKKQKGTASQLRPSSPEIGMWVVVVVVVMVVQWKQLLG